MKTTKQKLISEIIQLNQNYSFGDNAEFLYSLDSDELFEYLLDIKAMNSEADHNSH